MSRSPEKEALIIFAKNPRLGKVKTRLAKDIGHEQALVVYNHLLQHTRDATIDLPFDKSVYYSDQIEQGDVWDDTSYSKFVQRGHDLGERMHEAFKDRFDAGYSKICIIGTDCFEIEPAIVQEAFKALDTYDFAIGPAKDGGYYLLGMTMMTPELFFNKTYSTPSVYKEAIEEIRKLNKTVHQLPELSDVDHEKDLRKMDL